MTGRIQVRVLDSSGIRLMRSMLDLFAVAFEDDDTHTAEQPDDDYLARLLASDTFLALVAVDAGEAVGGLAAYELKKFEQARTEIYIYDLAVDERFRRQGVATSLIGELAKLAARRGASGVFVQAHREDEAAIALYSKLGEGTDVLHFDIPIPRPMLPQMSGRRVCEVPGEALPMDLLLEADPSEARIAQYLPGSTCFAAIVDKQIVGACVVKPLGGGAHELMNIAVHADHRKAGHGRALLDLVIDRYRDAGAERLDVGTGAFGYQLGFYQRAGFRVSHIERDFFLDNYPEPVYEDGLRHFDMLRLTLSFRKRPGGPVLR